MCAHIVHATLLKEPLDLEVERPVVIFGGEGSFGTSQTVRLDCRTSVHEPDGNVTVIKECGLAESLMSQNRGGRPQKTASAKKTRGGLLWLASSGR